MRYLGLLGIFLSVFLVSLPAAYPAQAQLSKAPEAGRSVGVIVACRSEIEGRALFEAVLQGQEYADELLGLGVCGAFTSYLPAVLVRHLSASYKGPGGYHFQLWEARIGEETYWVITPWKQESA